MVINIPPQDELNYPFEIDWVEVIDGINAATSLHLNSGDPELECLKAQICILFLFITISPLTTLFLKGKQEIDPTHGGKKWVARCDSFGKFLDLFGPLDNQTLSQVPLSLSFLVKPSR
jgi:hypothetical protein